VRGRFIKAVACTDFFTHEIFQKRIQIVPGAEHTFEAYTSPFAVLRNQKRQIIGQTILHVLLDDHFKKFTVQERMRLGETLKRKEETDRFWIKRLIGEHLKRTGFFLAALSGLVDGSMEAAEKPERMETHRLFSGGGRKFPGGVNRFVHGMERPQEGWD